MLLRLFFLFSFLISSPALASELSGAPWKLSADSFQREAGGQVVVAEGNVELASQTSAGEEVMLKADWLRYDTQKGLVHARGNVALKAQGHRATAEDASLKVEDRTGELHNATVFFQEHNLHFASEEASKEGEVVYTFHNGVFTTCDVEDGSRPMWSIKSVEADIDIDGFIFMKHCFLRLKDVPILYLPIITFPGRLDRQTGFMVPPEISTSDRSGYGLTTPFFINLSPSADITLYPSYLERRGAHSGAEFRQVFPYNSRIGLQGSYLHDKLIDTPDTPEDDNNNYKDDPYLRQNRERYWLRGKFDQRFSPTAMAMVDLDMASDRDFLMEFSNEMAGFDDSSEQFHQDFNRSLAESSLGWRDSSLQLNKWWDNMYLGGETVWVKEHDSHRTPGQDAVQTLPHLLANGLFELPGTPVNLNWDIDYTNYYRQEGLAMQRVDIFPRLLTPLPLGRFFEGSLLGGVEETYYLVDDNDNSFSEDTSPHRSVFYSRLDLATSLHRDFAMDFASVHWFNHMIRPRLDYTHLSHSSGQEELPDFDAKDRRTSQNSIGYGIDNHFRLGGSQDGKPYNRYFGLFKVSQSYNFQKERQEHPYSDVKFELELYPVDGLHIKYDTSLNVYGQGVVSYDLLSRFSHKQNSLAVDYRYAKLSEEHSLNGILELGLWDNLSFKGELQQSLASNRTVKQSSSLLYRAGCWAIQLVHSKDEQDRRLAIYFSLVGAGRVVGLGYTDDLRNADYDVKFNDEDLGHE